MDLSDDFSQPESTAAKKPRLVTWNTAKPKTITALDDPKTATALDDPKMITAPHDPKTATPLAPESPKTITRPENPEIDVAPPEDSRSEEVEKKCKRCECLYRESNKDGEVVLVPSR